MMSPMGRSYGPLGNKSKVEKVYDHGGFPGTLGVPTLSSPATGRLRMHRRTTNIFRAHRGPCGPRTNEPPVRLSTVALGMLARGLMLTHNRHDPSNSTELSTAHSPLIGAYRVLTFRRPLAPDMYRDRRLTLSPAGPPSAAEQGESEAADDRE